MTEDSTFMIRVRFIARWFVGLLLLFVAINGGFFMRQVHYWWQHDLMHKGFVMTEPIVGRADTMVIPKLGLDVPLVYPREVDEAKLQLALQQGVAHYPNTANPGELGNAYFFGHSAEMPWAKGEFKNVFALLSQLEAGDDIFVTDHRGTSFHYRVYAKSIVQPSQVEVLNQGDRKEAILTLQTSYPLGVALWRYLVQAKLV